MPHPAPDPLPSALQQLFNEGDHFLPSEQMLMDASLDHATAEDAAAAVAAATRAAEAEELRTPSTDEESKDEPVSALEITHHALRAENDRLRRALAAVEPGSSVSTSGPHGLSFGLQDDVMAQTTLRELASAAVGGLDFNFNSLQPLEMGDPSDYLHGLVAPIAGPSVLPPMDPLALTHASLLAELESTRAAIRAKDAAIAAAKGGNVPPKEGQMDDIRAVEAQSSRAATAIETARARAAVLRDVLLRVKDSRDRLKAEMDATTAQLGALDTRGLIEVRRWIEETLKVYKEKGTLPTAPLPSLPLLPTTPLAPPPSSLPKKRGRPPRSAPKPSVVPPQLAHLVPDQSVIAAKAADTPLRRKGIKRNKVELERERRREEEEGEMLRNLAGSVGAWARGLEGEEV